MAELKEKKKEVIYYDVDTFNRFNKLQQELKQTFKALKELHLQVLETDVIENYEAFLDNATDYLVSRWFGLNNHLYPYNTEPRKAFRILDVEISDIDYLNTRFKNLCKEMREYAPTINKTGIRFNINKARFEHVLDNNKQKHHKGLKKLLECVKEVEKYEENFNRSAIAKASQNITFSGLDLVVVNQNFI